VPRTASYVRGVHVLGRVLVALRYSGRAVFLFSSRVVDGWLAARVFPGQGCFFFGLLTTMNSCSLGGFEDG